MQAATVLLLITTVVTAVMVYMSLRIISNGQRAIVYRFGNFHRIMKPGLILLIPFIEKVQVVDLRSDIPGGAALAEGELEQKIKEKYVSGAS